MTLEELYLGFFCKTPILTPIKNSIVNQVIRAYLILKMLRNEPGEVHSVEHLSNLYSDDYLMIREISRNGMIILVVG